MADFAYSSAADAVAAVERAATRRGVSYIAGGTDLLQLVHDRVIEPEELVGVGALPLSGVAQALDGVRIGATTRLSELAEDPLIRERLPLIGQALEETASPQVRNMATVGGNLLQRTRCLYFRDPVTPCNKRVPGSGCPAQDGQNRINAILGGSEHCIAVHPSDLAVALLALDAEVVVRGLGGERSIGLDRLYCLPADTPHVETVLDPGELITGIWLPLAGLARRGHYLKVRDRASFEWALASCAVSLGFDGEQVIEARASAGGVATIPWRLAGVEAALVGQRLTPDVIAAAAEAATDGAVPRGRNAYKVPLLKRVVARALSALARPEPQR